MGFIEDELNESIDDETGSGLSDELGVPLTAQDVHTWLPDIDTPTIGQIQKLTSQSIITNTSFIEVPALGSGSPISDLISQDIVSENPLVSTGTIRQKHELLSLGVVTGLPIIDRPVVNDIAIQGLLKITITAST